jgi:uncharacterized alkaline shock family protein YloU
MDGQATISPEVLGSYAADAAREVSGVQGVVASGLHRQRGARVETQDGALSVELHLALERGVNIEDVGRAVQERVAGYLARMAGVTPATVDVVVAEIGPPPADRA